MTTERLYLEEPTRKTALAKVTARLGGGFLLDRTVYHAADARYHHAQPCDRGHLLVEGHKLKLDRVACDRAGRLVHRASGPPPAVGAKAQLHLDAPRRHLQARAHTLMHLLVAALAEARSELVSRAEVVGGGEVRVAVKLREAPASAWPKLASRVKQMVDARLPVEASWKPRDDAEKASTPQGFAFGAIAPDEPVLRVVRIGDACILPCDAPLVERSSDVGAISVAPPTPARDSGVRLRLKVVA